MLLSRAADLISDPAFHVRDGIGPFDKTIWQCGIPVLVRDLPVAGLAEFCFVESRGGDGEARFVVRDSK